MAEIIMTPENKPLLDALIQVVAGVRNPNAEDVLVNAIQELVRLRAENAAMRSIVASMATLDIEYRDEHLEFFCPACQAYASADWGTGRIPSGMTGHQWAAHRIKHEADCPVTLARAFVAAHPATTTMMQPPQDS